MVPFVTLLMCVWCLVIGSTKADDIENGIGHEYFKKFQIKPNGLTESVSLKRGKVECTFEWATTGGTDE
ncbi:hypothetical protein SARC_15973, partial [Sphaeroforma arctica JP610]